MFRSHFRTEPNLKAQLGMKKLLGVC